MARIAQADVDGDGIAHCLALSMLLGVCNMGESATKRSFVGESDAFRCG